MCAHVHVYMCVFGCVLCVHVTLYVHTYVYYACVCTVWYK